MKLFPLFADIENKEFLIIGHGNVARRKIAAVAGFSGNITVITGETVEDEGISEIKKACRKVYNRELKEQDLESADICICAFGDRLFHEKLCAYCKEKKIPLNVVDVPDMCTFVFPAIIKRGDLITAVSTSGKSPGYAAVFKREIEKIVPENIEEILECMGKLREELPEIIPDQRGRQEIYGKIVDIIFETGNMPSDGQTQEIIKAVKEGRIQTGTA